MVDAQQQVGNIHSLWLVNNNDGGDRNNSLYQLLERLLLLWTRLWEVFYIDSKLVSAVQNFDVGTMVKKIGVYWILNGELL